MTNQNTTPRFRNWDTTSSVLAVLGGALILAPVNLIGMASFAAFQKPDSFAYAQLRFLAANQWLLWAVTAVSLIAGFAVLIYMLTRATARFGNWLEKNYPGELTAADAGVLTENQPVIRPTGIYRTQAVGFMYGDLEIVREDLPAAQTPAIQTLV